MPWVMILPFAGHAEGPSLAPVPDAMSATSMSPPGLDTMSVATNEPESLVSLRSTADPSLLELSAPPSSLSDMSPTSPSCGWGDPNSLSPCEPPLFGSEAGTTLSSKSGGSISSEATLVDPLELKTSLDTPLKMFSDQQLPSSMLAPAPLSTLDGDGMMHTRGDSVASSLLGTKLSMGMSPLSPQLAPPSLDPLGPGLDECALTAEMDTIPADPAMMGAQGGGHGYGPSHGLARDGYAGGAVPSSASDAPGRDAAIHTDLSSSLPAARAHGTFEPSSLPILSSWTHPTTPV